MTVARFLSVAALVLGVAPMAHAQLNEHCTVSVLNRTVTVNRDGSWVLPNIPATFGPVRARATCIIDGQTVFGESEPFTVPTFGNVDIPRIVLGPTTPIPAAVTVDASTRILTSAGATVQLVVTARYPNASTRDVSAASTGTKYTITNPAIATVTADGLVQAMTSGTVFVQASQEGAAGLISIQVAIANSDSDGDGIPDDVELANGLDPNNPIDAFEDPDRDGLTSLQEVNAGTDPRVADTDADGLLDGQELALGTSPVLRDTDGDGVGDGLEREIGTNPLDPSSVNLAQALSSIDITPANFTLTLSPIIGDASQALTVTGRMRDAATLDLTSTARGTSYASSDLNVCNFGGSDGHVFAGAAGVCTITVTNSGFTAEAHAAVQTFTPSAVSFLTIPGFANSVVLNGDHAYVAAGSAGLHVVDVSNRAQPSIVATLDTPGNANDVRLVGSRAYVADGPGGLRIVDVTNPAAPAVLGSIATPGNDARDVSVSGSRAFVADGGGGLHIIDVATPATPVILGTATFDGPANGVDISGNTAIVAAGGVGVHAVDATNPASPVVVGTNFMFDPQDVTIVGTLAYVVDGGGLNILDLTQPIDSSLLASVPTATLTDVEVSGGIALAAEASFGSQALAFDVRNPVGAVQTASIDFSAMRGGDLGTGIALDSTYVYLTAAPFEDYVPNGVSGDTRLYIGQYRPIEDVAGVPPVVAILAPTSGTTMVEDETLPFEVTATDDVAVASVTFIVDGVDVFTDTTAPYQHVVTAPVGATSLVIGATARDIAGNVGAAPNVDVAITLDPLTTVIGRVVTLDAGGNRQPVQGATVTARGESGVSGIDGTFSIPGVRTARPGLRPDATIVQGGTTLFGSAAPAAPVRGGTTNVGDIILGSARFETFTGQVLSQCNFECSASSGELPFAFPFFGTSYNEIFINSWGNVTFVQEGQQPGPSFDERQHRETVSRFLEGPARIAPFWDDLMRNFTMFDPPSHVYLQTGLPDRVIVTWVNNAEFSLTQGSTITMQLVLYPDGRIQMAYRNVTALDAIVGITPGGGISPGRTVDFSATPYITGTANEAIYEQFEVPNPRGERDDSATRNSPFDLDGSFITFTPNGAGGYDVLRLPDSMAPTCTITSPANGATLMEGQPIEIVATASDGLGVLDVTFLSSDGSLSRTETSSPYTVPFVVPVGPTQLTFTARARDAASNLGTCSINVSVVAAPAPVVRVTAPAQGAQVIAGSTVTVQVDATSPIPLTAVRATVNGVPLPRSHATNTTFQVTVPPGAATLEIGASAVDNAGRTGNATGVELSVVSDPLTTVTGRVVNASAQPVEGAGVSVDLHGLTAEVFHFPTVLTSLPDLTGLTPAVVKTVPTLNLRNAGLGLGADPFGFGTSASRVIRFTGYINLTPNFLREFTVGSNHGAQFFTNGFRIIDMPDTGQFQERTALMADILSGWLPIQLIALDVNGDLDLQLLAKADFTEGPPLAIASNELEPILTSFNGHSDASGTFSIPNVPTTLGSIGVTALLTPPTGLPLRRQDPPIAAVVGGNTSFGDVDVVPYQPIYVEDAWAPGLYRVDQVTGTRRLMSASTEARNIRGVAPLRSGQLLMLAATFDETLSEFIGKVLLVDPNLPFDRNQQIISQGGLLHFPFAVREEASGTLLVKDQQRLIRVDPTTSWPDNQTLIATDLPSGYQSDLTIENADTALWSSDFTGGLVRIDLPTGTFAPVPLTSGCPRGVTMEGSNILFTSSGFCGEPRAIHRLTPGGVRTRILLWGTASHPHALALDVNGNIIVGAADGALFRVHPATGARTQIIGPAPGFSGGFTNSIAIAPPR